MEQQKTPERNIPASSEDEIDLRELWATIKKYRSLILGFTAAGVLVTLLYLLSTPNVYRSQTVLAPQEQSAQPGGGLGALAGLAGIELAGSQMDAYSSLDAIIKDYDFNRMIIEKYGLIEKLSSEQRYANYVFAFGFDGLFSLLNSKNASKTDDPETAIYETYKTLQKIISLSSDKKSGAITLLAEHPDRFFAKELVDIYLLEATSYLRKMEMADIEKKILFYEKELSATSNIELREKISQLISTLIQKRVLANSSEFYSVRQVVPQSVSNINDKIKPKRSLILLVALITSVILGVFAAFFMEFIKNSKKKTLNHEN